MINILDRNFFSVLPDEGNHNALSVVLISKDCALSGEIMKQVHYRIPHYLESVKKRIVEADKHITVGSCIKERDYLFIVARETYRSKWNEDVMNKIWKVIYPQLASQYSIIKIGLSDYPWMFNVANAYDDGKCDIRCCKECGWRIKE